ncbi:hypothetical protein [Streptosporangium sp. KLBMP 9127]|nr:hypothetical protein [Streptosporangium sp. KLBMP 9127]
MNRPVVPDELLRHLGGREHDARAQVDRLRTEIAELSDRLEDAQQLVSRLQLTRQTLLEIAGRQHEQNQSGTEEPLPPAYQEVLAVFTRTDGGLRAKDLCRALNIGDQPRHIESMRAKLKRLVGRDILTEPEPGLFAMNRNES